MSKKKILIVGAGGYIGSVCTNLLLQNDYEVIAIDNFSTGFKQPLELLQKEFGKDKLHIYELNVLSKLEEIFEEHKDIFAVIQYAACLSVNESMENPQKYFTNNVSGTQNLLSTMLKYGVKNIVFSSTCAVYGETKEIPITETHPTNPTNTYGQSKRMVEQILEWYGKLVGLHYVVLRYFNVCGATDDSNLGDAKKPSVHLVQNAVRGALGIEPFFLTYSSVDTPDKSPIRDYVNVVDLNLAHLKALEYLEKGGESEIINLGTGTGNSVLEIVETVEKFTDKKLSRDMGQKREGEYAIAIASIEKAKKVLGWEPERSLEDSIRTLIEWYKKYPNGWDY